MFGESVFETIRVDVFHNKSVLMSFKPSIVPIKVDQFLTRKFDFNFNVRI